MIATTKPRRGEQISGMDKMIQLLKDDASRPSLMGDVQPLREDPARLFAPMNVQPDPWQVEVLRSTASKILLLCSRQSGKSFIMAALSILEALTNPYAEVLIISKTLRQSTELLLKVKMLWRGLIGGRVHRRVWKPRSLVGSAMLNQERVKELGWDGAALINVETVSQVKDRALSMDFPNGSRITSLPGNPDTIVGFSAVTLLIIDEAARVSDALYNLVRPFLSATEAVHGRPGRMVVASTPFGKRGWFYEAWQNCEKATVAYLGGKADRDRTLGQDQRDSDFRDVSISTGRYSGEDAWLNAHYRLGLEGKEAQPPFQTFRVMASQCPRITSEFLADEKAMLGARWYAQEYETEFVASIDSVFDGDKIDAMIQPGEGELMLYFE